MASPPFRPIPETAPQLAARIACDGHRANLVAALTIDHGAREAAVGEVIDGQGDRCYCSGATRRG